MHLYCDEAGNMPVEDTDDAFVSAVVAVNDVRVSIPERYHAPEWTAKYLKELRAFPTCNYVRPRIGFGRTFAQKLAAVKFMVETDRKNGRPREWFQNPEDVRPKNFVWIFSMEIAIGASLITPAFMFNFSVERISVHLNAKSFSPDMKKFFVEFLRGTIPRTAKQIFVRGAQDPKVHPKARKWNAAAAERMGPEAVDIEWDDEPTFSGDRGVMWLAHSLANNTHAEVRMKDRRPGMAYEMARVGIQKFWSMKDITEKLERPNYKAHRNWERETGVKIPHQY